MEIAIDIDDRSAATANHLQKKKDIDDRSTETNHGMAIMKKRLGELPGDPFDARSSVTIFRFPFHEEKKEFCEPKVVSIGPYHRDKESLRTMKDHKWFTLRDFLARNKTVGFEFYYQAMKSIEAQTRQCYSENVDLNSDDFIMMLLLDGCFILELLFKVVNGKTDSIFKTGWNGFNIISDLWLMENQVPLFVIHNLWSIQEQGVGWSSNCSHPCPLLDLLSETFESSSHESIKYKKPQKSCTDIWHLLDLYFAGVTSEFECQRCQTKEPSLATNSSQQVDYIPNACYLQNAGIKFRKKKAPTHMLDISFKNGIFQLPFIKIDSRFARILWNMVAFEQICVQRAPLQSLSSYFVLMNSLFGTEKDVVLLEKFGLVHSYFPTAHDAAASFKQLYDDFALDFDGLFKDVRAYSDTALHKYTAHLRQDYFSDPWAVITSILFILTVVQTYASFK